MGLKNNNTYKDFNSSLKGSLTIEACIVLPIFICFISLVLFFAKFACIDMLIKHAVNETAKELAASSYPISFVNGYENDFIDEYGIEKISAAAAFGRDSFKLDEQNDGVKLKLFGFNDFDMGIDSIFSEASIIARDGLTKYLAGNYSDEYWLIKNKTKYAAASNILKSKLSKNKLIDLSNIKLKLVLLPQGEAEYEIIKSIINYESFGLRAEKDFCQDDVVIQTEYALSFKMPFIGNSLISMLHTAVERAWIFGSNGVITSPKEGFDFLNEASIIVYITKTGIRYHIASCRYLHSSKIPIELKEALDSGYTPCKVCKPTDKE